MTDEHISYIPIVGYIKFEKIEGIAVEEAVKFSLAEAEKIIDNYINKQYAIYYNSEFMKVQVTVKVCVNDGR